MKTVVILNPHAGPTRNEQAGDWIRQLEELFHKHGVQAVIHSIDAARIAETVQAALTEKVDAVIAGGGDGTINSVAATLTDTKTPLGVLPLGTFNHFAKDLGIPLSLEEAVQTIAQGVTRDIDVGEVNGHIFLNNSSMGAYPQAVKERDQQRRQLGRRKTAAMVIAILRVLRVRPLFRVRLTLDGESFYCRTPFVFVGNNEYGGNFMTESKRACLDGGKLCVCTANCTGFFCLVRLVFATLRNRLDRSKDFDSKTAREVRIDPHDKVVRVACDGEVFKLETPLHYRVRPGALRVIVPAESRK